MRTLHVKHVLAPRHPVPHQTLMRMLFGLGSVGLFLVAIVDSSVVPLPVPGSTDILLILLAAHHRTGPLLVVCATIGSVLGAYTSYQIGVKGGLPALERYVSPKYLERVCLWVEKNALLAIALPAMLPPPMPLSPFIVAAGALSVPKKQFLITFGAARAIRFSLVAALAYHFGRSIIRTWNRFFARWGTTMDVCIFVSIASTVGFFFWKYWRSQKQARVSAAEATGSTSDATVRSAS